MGKKSNKTEHVLKLITKNEDADAEESKEATFESEDENAAAPGEYYEEELTEEPEPDLELSAPETPREKAARETEAEEAEDPAAEELAAEELAAEELAAEEPAAEEPAAEEPAQEEANTEIVAEEIAGNGETAGEVANQEKPIDDNLECSDDVAHEPRSNKLLNLAEELAKQLLPEVAKRMNVCSCQACQNDILALTLNALPQKFVTTDTGKQYAKLLSYRTQNETDVIAALTRACVRVKSIPRH